MSLRERFYSILIVSATDKFTLPLLTCSRKQDTTLSILLQVSAQLKQTLAEKTFDFIIINTPLPDDMGIRFAIDTCATKLSVVLLLVKSDIHADIHDKVAEYGVFTLPKPTSKPTCFRPSTGWKVPENG